MSLVDEALHADIPATKKKVLALFERCQSQSEQAERAHPVYLTLLKLKLTECHVLEKSTNWHKDSLASLNDALQMMQENRSAIMEQSIADWQIRRRQLMDSFNHNFVLILHELSGMLRDENVTRVLNVICSDAGVFGHLTLVLLLKDEREVCACATKSLFLISDVMLHLVSYKMTLLAFKNYCHNEEFQQSNILYFLLDIIQPCIWESLRGFSTELPETNRTLVPQSKIIDRYNGDYVQKAVQYCINYLRVLHYASAPMGSSHLPYLIALATRLARISMKDDLDRYQHLPLALQMALLSVWLKKDVTLADNLWLQQFYFDLKTIPWQASSSFTVEWEKLGLQIDQHLEGKVVSRENIAACIVAAWHKMNSITHRMYMNNLQYIAYKVRHIAGDTTREKMANYEKKSHIKEDVYSLFTWLRMANETNSELQEVLRIVRDVGLHIQHHHHNALLPAGLMPLAVDRPMMPGIFACLPLVAQLYGSEHYLATHKEYLTSQDLHDEVVFLQKYYTSLKEVLLFFSEHRDWFAQSITSGSWFKEFVTSYLNPRLLEIESKQREESKKLLEDADRYQKAESLSKFIADRFVAEQETKNRLRHESRQKKKAQCQQVQKYTPSKFYANVVKKDAISQNDFQHESLSFAAGLNDDSQEDMAEKMLHEAMRWFSKGHEHKARECYVKLGDHSEHYKPEAVEGIFACQVRIVSKQLTQLKRRLQAIAVSNSKVSDDQVQACYKEFDRLHGECEAIIHRYPDLVQTLQSVQSTEVHANLDFMQVWRDNLKKTWDELSSVKNAVVVRLNYTRYEEIMRLGFQDQNIEDADKRREIFDIGMSEHVHGKPPLKTESYKEFDKVYQEGRKKFIAKGTLNREKFGKESAYASMRELLQDLDKIIAAARGILMPSAHSAVNVASSSSASSASALSGPPLSKAPIATDGYPIKTIQSTSASVECVTFFSTYFSSLQLLEYLREFQLMDVSEKEMLSKWVKANPQSLFDASAQSDISSLAYECVSAWFLTSVLKDRVAFLDESGLLRWFLSLRGAGPLIPKKNANALNQRLNNIAKALNNIQSSDWQVDLIFAQILTAILVSAFDQSWHIDNLQHFGLKDKPLRKMCVALQLSGACQSALHAYLVTHVRLNQSAALLHKHKTVQELDSAVLKYNRALFLSANIEKTPAWLVIYGSSAYLDFIPHTDHAPADLDICTNLPLSECPFPITPHQHLAAQKIYRRCFGVGQIENGISIKFEDAPIMEMNQTLDFTISQAMFHGVLHKMVYWTNEAYEDLLNNKRLTFIKPIGALYDDPQLILRILIAGNNTKFYLNIRDAERVKVLVALECEAATKEMRSFLKPVIVPDCLLHFLFTYCVYRSAEQYLTLADHYNLLPLLLPVPINVLSDKTITSLKAPLQQFDQDRDTSLDGWMLLGKLIASVFVTLMSDLKDGHALINAALQELPNFLPDKPRLMSAVQHYLTHYVYKPDRSQSSTVPLVFTPSASKSGTLSHAHLASLQDPILPTPST